MPALRGHHLICLHFFDGSGYDREFIANLEKTIRDADDKEVEILSGADDICIKCPYLKNAACTTTENADEDIMEMDRRALELLSLSVGNRMRWGKIEQRLRHAFPEWYIRYCSDCEWINTCEKNTLFRKMPEMK
jgi:hypothetical protein